MFFQKKKYTTFVTDEVSKICATCKFAAALHSRDDEYLCSKKGLVSYNHKCRHYAYNSLLKQPQKKHSLNTSRFSAEDFEI